MLFVGYVLMGLRMAFAREVIGSLNQSGVRPFAVMMLWYEALAYGVISMISGNRMSEDIQPLIIDGSIDQITKDISMCIIAMIILIVTSLSNQSFYSFTC